VTRLGGKTPSFSAAVEGLVDEAVVRAIARHAEVSLTAVYGKCGKAGIVKKLEGYNNAARHTPWVVLLDLDNSPHCPPKERRLLLPNPAPRMCFRLVVRAVEAWLLADRERIASFLGIRRARVPLRPEEEPDPKATLLGLVQQSTRSAIRDDILPRPRSGRRVGPAYTGRMIEFAQEWRCDVARKLSPSLDACLRCVERVSLLGRG
jgi:hypothetical protein